MGNRMPMIVGLVVAEALAPSIAKAETLFVGDGASDSPSVILEDGTVSTISHLYTSKYGAIMGGKDDLAGGLTVTYGDDYSTAGIGQISDLDDPTSASLSIDIPITDPRGFNTDPTTEGVGVANRDDDTLLLYSDPIDPGTESIYTAHQSLSDGGADTDPTGFLPDTANNVGLTGLEDPGKWALIDLTSNSLLASGDIPGPSAPIHCPDTNIGILLGEGDSSHPTDQKIYVFDLATQTLASTISATNIYPEMGTCFTDPSGATTLLIAGDNLSDWTEGGVQFIDIDPLTGVATEETYIDLAPYNVNDHSLGVSIDSSIFWTAHGKTVLEGDTSTQSLTGVSYSLTNSSSILIPFTPPTSTDLDLDGYDSIADGGTDCDDTNASTYPGATEIWYDGVDSDCAGDNDYDADADSHDSNAYGGNDCDDTNASTYPGATEIWYDGVDSDCAGNDDFDADGDGFSTDLRGITSGAGDCDDTDPSINPGATETCDGVDEDCDTDIDEEAIDATTWYVDADGDGHGNALDSGTEACEEPTTPGTDYVTNNDDPDDTNSATYPGATEISDGKDNDGDDLNDECLFAEGADWTTAAACEGLTVGPHTMSGLAYTPEGYYTYDTNEEGEYVITFHGTEGEGEVERGGDDIVWITGEAGDELGIGGSIGSFQVTRGKQSLGIVEEHDAADHWGIYTSEHLDISREDNVQVLEGETVVTNTSTGEVDKDKTTAGEVLDEVKTDTGDTGIIVDTGMIDTGDTATDSGEETGTQPDTDEETDQPVDTGVPDDSWEETGTPPPPPQENCNGCSSTENSKNGLDKLLGVLGLTGLLATIRRRRTETEIGLGENLN